MPPDRPCPPRRVVVLGVGAMGRLHSRVFASLPRDFKLVGVFDPSLAAAREVATLWDVAVFPDETEAILAADLVVVASPIAAHADSARRALARGRDVFVEKPVCASSAQATALVRSVGQGQRLFVGHSERFNPVVRALHALLRPGDIRTIRLRRTSVAARAVAEHGALVSLGVHDLDLVAHLTESPVTLRQVAHADDDGADLVLAAAQGAIAWIHVDRRARHRERLLEVTTADTVYTGDLLGPTLSSRRRDGAEVAHSLPEEEPLVAQATAIARALRGSCEVVASGVDGARALSLALEATARPKPPRPLALET